MQRLVIRLTFSSGLLLSSLLLAALTLAVPAHAADPVSLNQVPVPEPVNLAKFVVDKNAAIRLGKALFWDMQLGSDGLTACATCHFHAGTDNRTRNTLHTGGDGKFNNGNSRPNADLSLTDFPFVRFVNPVDRTTARTERDDRIGAQGVNKTQFLGIVKGQDKDPGRIVRDGTFHSNGRNVRQSTGRNAPTTINAVFNFANFLDGRANHYFNGVNPFGIMDVEARVYRNDGTALVPISLVNDLQNNPWALDNASLASQAVGPPLNDVEMSWGGRSWPDLGRKMLALKPLAKQTVHPGDSSLATLRDPSGKGLATTYGALIQTAAQPEFWNSPA